MAGAPTIKTALASLNLLETSVGKAGAAALIAAMTTNAAVTELSVVNAWTRPGPRRLGSRVEQINRFCERNFRFNAASSHMRVFLCAARRRRLFFLSELARSITVKHLLPMVTRPLFRVNIF